MIVVSPFTDLPVLTPLIVTVFAPLKPVPVIVIFVPTGPDMGVKVAIEGGGGTVKTPALAAGPLAPSIEIGPVVVPMATIASIFLSLLTVKLCAGVPLISTEVVPRKRTPLRLTFFPGTPWSGENFVIVGGTGTMVNVPVWTVPSPVVMEIVPDVAPSGTVVTRRVSRATRKVAGWPSKVTE